MTTEKYVKTIVKKIKCSKEKRLEISQKLLEDISIAQKNGESLDDVMRRMGNSEVVAEKYNRNMPEEEIEKFEKNVRVKATVSLIVVALVLLCLVLWMRPKSGDITKSKVFETTAVEEQAKWVVEELNDNDLDALMQESTERMKKSLTQETIDSAREAVDDDWGAFQSFERVYVSEVKQRGKKFACAQIEAVYDNVTVVYTISFDKNMKLAGMYIK